ncbi:MAG: hypothetical protein KGJ86_15190 [Chloroflexota bacterium]|nr:hypothetical protein [Chloroflexota bacterium]
MSSLMMDPRGGAATAQRTLAPRVGTLRGATIGLLGNAKRNSDVVLAEIGTILVRNYGAKEAIFRSKPNPSYLASTELVDELAASCDVVIAGVGD